MEDAKWQLKVESVKIEEEKLEIVSFNSRKCGLLCNALNSLFV